MNDLPLIFHPVAIRASAGDTPRGARLATGDRRSWSGVAQPIACCGEIGSIARRCHVAQRGMRPLGVVVVGPDSNGVASMIEPEECVWRRDVNS